MVSTTYAPPGTLMAVITGDIVGSQRLPVAQFHDVMQRLQQRLEALQADFQFDFDIYRGDSFQLALRQPCDAALLVSVIQLGLAAGMPAVKVRQCIGLGKSQPLARGVKVATGEAFTLSGRGLDTLKNGGILVQTSCAAMQYHLALVTKYFASHLARLTTTQSEVVLAYLLAQDKSHEGLAAQLNKTRSNVTRILNTSQYHLITGYLKYFAELVEKEWSPCR
ncbi:hypothetical protein [Alteromonas gilva]|uniref:MarR family transcriptional regulator n=1 Tax=Alteromonas gilva TaxID=2987522 RepID=A0ABT5L172_9ALTE|nr:hypothetical protein [Alteromonas gilva]MDC8830791.1 hypothetical protein [Alteromonas gilva]